MSTFLTDFTSFLESIALSPRPLAITGDFNVKTNNPNDCDAIKFLDLSEAMGLSQQSHVKTPTHDLGHILDLVITHQSDNILSGLPESINLYQIMLLYCLR